MYPEIEQLKQAFINFDIRISKPFDVIKKELFFTELSIDNQSWRILIDDEYQDFSTSNSLINWFLILHSLELYKESDDFLDWSKQCNVTITQNNLLSYYQTLAITYPAIEKIIGEIDPCISAYDYNLRTGVFQALLQ